MIRTGRWRGLLCLVIVAILCGFFVEGRSAWTPLPVAAAALGMTACLGVGLWGRKRRHAVWLCVCMAGAAFSFACGAWREAQRPVWINAWLGQPVLAEGVLEQVSAGRGGTLCTLEVTRLRPVADASLWEQCQVTTLWLADDSGDPPQPGARVALAGVLTAPSRSLLPWQPPEYGFRGRLRHWSVPSPSLEEWLHSRMDEHLAVLAPAGEAGNVPLLDSLVFGSGQVEPNLHQEFLRAGLLHVLAASGANVVLLLSALSLLLRPLRWLYPRRLPFCVAKLAFLCEFTRLCGGQPSIVRAALMAAYRELGLAWARAPKTIDGMLVAACAMAIWRPATLLGLSAWLSFAATAAIQHALSHAPRVTGGNLRQRLWAKGLETLWVCLMVEAWLTPFTLLVFHQLTPYALLANLLGEPLLTLLLPLATATDALALLPQVGPVVLLTRGVLLATLAVLHVFLQWTGWVAHLPGALVQAQVGNPLLIAAWYMLLLLAPRVRNFTAQVWTSIDKNR
ncbi:ComEC/Rec2 family competence protein [Alicyclobacillus shizuokensis]|uniref:ComEC/Rec2 family competence protein n=1 Tax=Alicyclobacillus shizuokensis TaxID=392014 RepID=UPI0008335CC2|nr:ComEC/Rec2 family competence protein [Alicyclobacillus shizuokensis]MCL6626157.1 ComEC family competence protein [Alicyclobacillus shizuokensis]